MPIVDYQSPLTPPPKRDPDREQNTSDVVAGKLLSVFLLFFGLPFVAALAVGIYGVILGRDDPIIIIVAIICGVMGIAMWATGIALLRRKA